jgi:Rieske 2Fe-2S family protein
MTTGQTLLEKSLPSSAYLRDDVFAREREMIFLREWIFALREEELQEPGAFKLVELLGESVLLVRTQGGELRAHYNVCRHRGARLCTTRPALHGTGNPSGVLPNGTIRCPYHSWTYDLDGHLRSAPHLGDKLAKERASLGLHPIGVEVWGGFVFLNLTPAESKGSLRDQLGSVHGRVSRYPLAELRSAHRIAYDVAANWKVIAENYNECYHCGPVHPELCEVVPAFRTGGGANLTWEEGVPHREGAFTFTRSGTTDRTPFATLSGEEKVRHKGEIVYPNLFLSLSPEHVAAFSLLPEAPGRTRVVCDFLFHPAEMAKPGFDPHDAVEFWDLINRQDWAICEEVQRGISSRVHRFGYYAPMEDLSLDIRRYVTERIGDISAE